MTAIEPYCTIRITNSKNSLSGSSLGDYLVAVTMGTITFTGASIMKTILVSVMLATAVVAGPASAATSSPMRYAAPQASPLLGLPPPPVTPQFNTPGPQLALPVPGNPLQQASPLGTLSPSVGSPVVQMPPIVNPFQQTTPLGSTVIP
jgi:hypothetical protein